MTNIYDAQSFEKIFSLEKKTNDISTQKRNVNKYERNVNKYVVGWELFDGKSKLTLRRILNFE